MAYTRAVSIASPRWGRLSPPPLFCGYFTQFAGCSKRCSKPRLQLKIADLGAGLDPVWAAVVAAERIPRSFVYVTRSRMTSGLAPSSITCVMNVDLVTFGSR